MRWALLVLAALAACGRGADVIVVGSKNFTEQRILGELLAQTVESVGLRAERKLDLGGTFVCDAAIRAGQIDMYVEYTGTALAAILKEKPEGMDRAQVLARVREAYAKDGLVWTAPFGFDNTFALVVRRDAEEVRTISDLAAHPGDWRAGFGYEFKERADGYPGLAQAYGLELAEIRIMDLGLLYRALVDQKVDVVAGNATDGQIESLKLKVLVDDRGYFPPYEAAPVVRRVVLERYPKLAAALEGLGGRISVQGMRRMNYEVDGGHRGPSEVVREFRTAS
ncbi:MAG: ABC transporter substrate-binding protein [Deltaproteobacteria bacterium]|nr:MAG: ABC transporter substrate-binding protein [Deltaproteobacteria bacterium]